jgi:nitroreductase
MKEHDRVPLEDYIEYPPADMVERAAQFHAEIRRRHTVRQFSDRPVDRRIIEHCLLAAGTAPNGANHQPWFFSVIGSAEKKKALREQAEAEERNFYAGKGGTEWLEALAPLGTDADKPFLETAPVLIAIFGRKHSETPAGTPVKNYYVTESVGIATGFLIAALHHAGLATLTHTPSPMGFLNQILSVDDDARPAILLVVGYPAPGCTVPSIGRKPLDAIAKFL